MAEGEECKVALLLGGVEGVSDTVMEEVGECVMYWIGKWWQRKKDLLHGEVMDGFWSPLLHPSYEQLDTAHALLLIIFSLPIYLLINSMFQNVFFFFCFSWSCYCAVCGGLTGSTLTRLNYKTLLTVSSTPTS